MTGNAITVLLGDRRRRRGHEHGQPGHRGDQRRSRRRAKIVTRHASTAPPRRTASSSRASSRRSATCCAPRRRSRAARRRVTMLRIGKVAQRHQGRRLPLLPGARGRDRDLGRVPGDRGAPAAQLRHRCPDHALVDGLDIFLVPQINGDGAIHSIYDSPRRTNMAPYCYDPASTREPRDPANRNSYGRQHQPQLQRRLVLRRLPGREHGLLGRQHRRPVRALRARDPQRGLGAVDVPQHQVLQQHPLLRRLLHVAPGSYTPQRVTLPYPPYGTLNFFDQAARHVLDGIKTYRGTAIRPQRTGPVIDVLYSAAGNSADEAYYNYGIIGYDFEIGATCTTTRPHHRRRDDVRPGSAAAVRRFGQRLPRQRGLQRGDGVHRRQLRPAAVGAGLLQRRDPAGGRRPARRGRRTRLTQVEVHVRRGEPRSTTRPTARRPPRPRRSTSRPAPGRCRSRS